MNILAILRHQTSSGLQLRDFDALRGWAVMGVVVAHYSRFTAYLGLSGYSDLTDCAGVAGLAGVDVFFFISGFLLYLNWGKAYMEDRREPDLAYFYKRRALRIMPAYYVSMAVILALYMTVLESAYHPASMLKDVLYHLFFVHNIDIETIHSINGVYWSLAAEAQFYLIMPLLVSWFYGRNSFWGLPAFVLFSMGFKLMVFLLYYPDTYVFFRAMQLLPSKIDLFAIGMTFANIWLYSKKANTRPVFARGTARYLLFVSLIVLLAGQMYLLGRYWRDVPLLFIFWEELFLVSLGAMVLASLEGGFGKAILVNPVMEFVGIISYSVFLWHNFVPAALPLIPFVGKAEGTEKFVVMLGGSIVVTAIVSVLSYMFIEKPFLKLRLSKKVRPGRDELPQGA